MMSSKVTAPIHLAFMRSITLEIERFYSKNHDSVAAIIANCEEHLNRLNSLINGQVDDSRKFDFLLELQDKLLKTIVPELTQQAEDCSRQAMCQDILVNPNYEKYMQVALENAFRTTNVLVKQEKPVTLEEVNYDSLTLFTA